MAVLRFARRSRNVAPGSRLIDILPECSRPQHTMGMIGAGCRRLMIIATVRTRRASARRAYYTASMRVVLLLSDVSPFATHCYAGTSLDTIATRARVTKGALYHHFKGKQDLSEAAFSAVERNVYSKLQRILEKSENLWVKAGLVVREYLQSCLDPAYQ